MDNTCNRLYCFSQTALAASPATTPGLKKREQEAYRPNTVETKYTDTAPIARPSVFGLNRIALNIAADSQQSKPRIDFFSKIAFLVNLSDMPIPFMKKLKENPDFIPYIAVEGDEMLGGFPFNWHVTRATEWIQANLEIKLNDFKKDKGRWGVAREVQVSVGESGWNVAWL
ncbi:hypothetical protein I858_011290 [Planococcus versutus]|uniref:Uncharacterized protein n=1 Tax=Planococcus versutus TaxID=1302659 RepID=A0A1B1S345_9BACL|nr:hypothetical protein I858_011290 [Planococcus versutus]